jgi:pheophorbide a oxygenase
MGPPRQYVSDRPTEVQFLGLSYVAYLGNNNEWVVADNACAHRLAPLSEGRIGGKNGDQENGGGRILECSYHGWAYDNSGQCLRIPQADAATEAAALRNPSCKVKTYSVRVEKNLLWAWLWPEDVLEYMLSSSMKKDDDGNDSSSIEPKYMLKGVLAECSTYTRELPYGWDTLLENIVDPSHVPFVSC